MSQRISGFTQEQKDAISYDYSNGSLLVSAAAGSGKSTVLVERLINLLESDETIDIDEFLVITYTRAAASDIREKIQNKLLELIAEKPLSKHLRRQLLLSRTAAIGTIHTFCAEVLRENAHKSMLSPDFRILDENESAIIMAEVADRVILRAYENINTGNNFRRLVDTVTEGRDDKQLNVILLDIYRKLQSTPNPSGWVRSQLEQLDTGGISDLSFTKSGDYVLRRLYETVLFCKEEMLFIKNKMEKSADFIQNYESSITDIQNYIDTLLTSLSNSGWDEARRNCDFEVVKNKFTKILKGFNKSNELIETRNRIIKNLKTCDTELEFSSEEHIKEMAVVNPAITALLSLVLEFSSEYSLEKQSRGAADFSDLEHLSLSLLTDESKSDKKSELAGSLSKKYKEIMVDEYQDVNEVQELIFNRILNKDKKLFMVGDVKQSIYRFRLADPSIFLKKNDNFSEYNKIKERNNEAEGTKIHLSYNFRSHPEILEFVNNIYRNVMSKDFGEIDYTESEELKSPPKNTEQGIQGKKGIQGYTDTENNPNTPVSVEILDVNALTADIEEDSPAAITLEADYVAAKIRKMIDDLEKIPVKENGIIIGEREIVYSDIVILLRSVKSKAHKFSEALKARNIPYEFDRSEGFFETVEVTTVLALLSIIDNPLQDISLATIMTGPLYNFTSDELAEIRCGSQGTDYYTALKNKAENTTGSDELSVKCLKMLKEINELHEVQADMTSDRFIWHVYNKTGLLGLFGAMKDGNKRRENLILLVESARSFEKNGYKGLFGFLVYIKKLRDKGGDLPEGFSSPLGSKTSSEINNAVRIMSIHKSKGLEFPVVILANAGSKFNFPDIRSNIVFHKDIGIGSMLVEQARRIKYTTLARDVILKKLKEEMLFEELRVLYVAMTRAEERLYIIGTHRYLESTVNKIKQLPHGKIHPLIMLSLQNPVEWVLAGLRDDPKKIIKYISSITAFDNSSQAELSVDNRFDAAKSVELPAYQYDEFKYPYENVIEVRSKTTVTAKSKQADPDPEAELRLFANENYNEVILRQPPAFIKQRDRFTPAERGTIMHNVMQHIDYNTSSDDDMIEKELMRLQYENFISEEERLILDKKKIKRFLESTIVKRLRESTDVKREFRFSILNIVDESTANADVDKQLLQGVIDCFFKEDGEYVIVDFKTDKVTTKNIHEKVRQYEPQLDEYSKALERIIKGSRVKEKILYFFDMESNEEHYLIT